jgi:hypothetical protein
LNWLWGWVGVGFPTAVGAVNGELICDADMVGHSR